MYKAIHNYSDSSPKSHTLSFSKGDTICVLEKTNNTWWLASNSSGKIGYIPCAYMKTHDEFNSKDVVLNSVDRAIAAIHASSKQGSLSTEQKSILRKLNMHKESILAAMESKIKDGGKRRAPPPPSRVQDERQPPPPPQRSMSNKRVAPSPGGSNAASSEKNELSVDAPHLPEDVNVQRLSDLAVNENVLDVNHAPQENVESDKNISHRVPAHLGQDLLNRTQDECQLTQTKSRDLIVSLLSAISDGIPSLCNVMEEIIETLPHIQTEIDPAVEKLRMALADIMDIKNDAQQRSWAIEDDREKISTILNDIMESLSTGSKYDCSAELLQDDYIVALAVYYQMETRVDIRLLVLQVLGVICSMSNKFVSILLTSVLPNELVQDITDHTDDVQRVCFSALVLSMTFSTGEPIPVQYYDTIGEKFIAFVLESIENGLSADVDDQVGDIFVRLILAINLHFLVPDDNLTMKSISSRSSCTILSEKIMLLINRGDDPVKICDEANDPQPPNSVLKFLQDVFSRSDTAQTFLYTNDLLVLTDIISRNITDLPSGSEVRTEYLDLLLNVVARSPYHETKHRAAEILACLERILAEEMPLEEALQTTVEFDKKIVHTILNDYKVYLV